MTPDLLPAASFLGHVASYFVALMTYVMGMVIYTTMTPHSEVKMMRAGNPAAALSFSATLLALALPIAAAVHDTHNPMEILIWGANAVLFQLIAYFGFIRLIPEINTAIEEGKTASVLPLAAAQISVALLNAAIFAG